MVLGSDSSERQRFFPVARYFGSRESSKGFRFSSPFPTVRNQGLMPYETPRSRMQPSTELSVPGWFPLSPGLGAGFRRSKRFSKSPRPYLRIALAESCFFRASRHAHNPMLCPGIHPQRNGGRSESSSKGCLNPRTGHKSKGKRVEASHHSGHWTSSQTFRNKTSRRVVEEYHIWTSEKCKNGANSNEKPTEEDGAILSDTGLPGGESGRYGSESAICL